MPCVRRPLASQLASPGACSLSAHVALHEAGLAHEAIKAPTKTKTLADGSDYRLINPLGYVPYLVLDSGEGLREGPAIVQYIADQAPEKHLAWVDGELAGKQYLMGDTFTVTDGYLFTVTNWPAMIGIDLSDLTKQGLYRARVGARPGVQAAMKAEGLI
jgi:glutathione S-transferase